jgi:hypothetical protein
MKPDPTKGIAGRSTKPGQDPSGPWDPNLTTCRPGFWR